MFPPSGSSKVDWGQLAKQWASDHAPSGPPATQQFGHPEPFRFNPLPPPPPPPPPPGPPSRPTHPASYSPSPPPPPPVETEMQQHPRMALFPSSAFPRDLPTHHGFDNRPRRSMMFPGHQPLQPPPPPPPPPSHPHPGHRQHAGPSHHELPPLLPPEFSQRPPSSHYNPPPLMQFTAPSAPPPPDRPMPPELFDYNRPPVPELLEFQHGNRLPAALHQRPGPLLLEDNQHTMQHPRHDLPRQMAPSSQPHHQPVHVPPQSFQQSDPSIADRNFPLPHLLPPVINSGSAVAPSWHQPAYGEFTHAFSDEQHHQPQAPPALMTGFLMGGEGADKSGSEPAMVTPGGRKLPSWLKLEIEEIQAKKEREANRMEMERQRDAYRKQNLEKLLSGQPEYGEREKAFRSDYDDGEGEEEDSNHEIPDDSPVRVSQFEHDEKEEYNSRNNSPEQNPLAQAIPAAPSESPPLDPEQRLMMKIRTWMTEILLQVTNEEIASAAGEVHERSKIKRSSGVTLNTASSRSAAQLVRDEGQGVTANRLSKPSALVAYGSDEEDDANNEGANSPSEEIDSDEELQRSIDSKLAAWPKKANRYNAEAEGLVAPPSPPSSVPAHIKERRNSSSASRSDESSRKSEKKRKRKRSRSRDRKRSRSKSRERKSRDENGRSHHRRRDDSDEGGSRHKRSRSRSPKHKSSSSHGKSKSKDHHDSRHSNGKEKSSHHHSRDYSHR